MRPRPRFLLIIIFLSFSLTKSQAQIFTRPLPKRWVPKEICVNRQAWFTIGSYLPGGESKFDILSSIIGKETRGVFYPVSAIDNMFDLMEKPTPAMAGIRVYITAFDSKKAGPLDVTYNIEKEILLVFAPVVTDDASSKDRGDYYVIANTASGPNCYSVQIGDLENWVNHYLEYIDTSKNGLATTIDPKAKENLIENYTVPSDTKCIFYPYAELKQFLGNEKGGERKYQERKFQRVSGIQVNFAAYPNTGEESTEPGDRYKYRLLLQFEYTQKNGNADVIFYIDDEKNFFRRLKKTGTKANKGGDNGTLCPPCVNCPPGTLGCDNNPLGKSKSK